MEMKMLKQPEMKMLKQPEFFSGNPSDPFERLLPDAGRMSVTCPICHVVGRLPQIVIDLNDCHRWTREAIADWLDTLPEQPKAKVRKNAPKPAKERVYYTSPDPGVISNNLAQLAYPKFGYPGNFGQD